MIVEMNESVQKVVEFMQREIPADELRGVARMLPAVAEAIWAAFPATQVNPMRLTGLPISWKQGEQSVAT
jgi:hypothetical protein